MSEAELQDAVEPPNNVIEFTSRSRVPRLQHLSDDQMTRLLWLLNQTELLEKLLRQDLPKLMTGCPVAQRILND